MSKTQKDDFLQQILEAETQAKKDLETAYRKNQDELVTYETKLTEKRKEKTDEVRSVALDKIKDRQAQARKTYENLISEGEREAAKQEKDLMAAIDKSLPQIQNYFVNELL